MVVLMNLAASLPISKWAFLRRDFKSCIQGWWVRGRHLASVSPVTCGQTHWNIQLLFLLIADMASIHMKKLKTRKAISTGADIQGEKETKDSTSYVSPYMLAKSGRCWHLLWVWILWVYFPRKASSLNLNPTLHLHPCSEMGLKQNTTMLTSLTLSSWHRPQGAFNGPRNGTLVCFPSPLTLPFSPPCLLSSNLQDTPQLIPVLAIDLIPYFTKKQKAQEAPCAI